MSEPAASPARLWILCFGVSLGLFLAMLDTSIVATSLFAISTDLGDFRDINWVALAYTLSYMGCAVVFSRVSDIIGRRDAYLVAYVIFIAFSLACGFARNLHQLIAFRAAQGIGGSGLYSLTMIALPELTPKQYLQYIGALIGMVIAMAGVLGPVLGGLLTSYASWKWVFWINGPIGVVSMALLLLSWPRTKGGSHTWKQLDYIGSLLTISSAVLFVFAFQNAGQSPNSAEQGNNWGSALFIAPAVVGIVSWVALVLWEYVLEHRFPTLAAPVLPVRLFRNRVYTSGVVNTLLLGFPYLLLIYVVPLRIQIVGGKSALLAGVYLLPMLAGTAFGSFASGAINTKKSAISETLLIGSCFMLIGTGLLTTVSTTELDMDKLLGFITFCGLGFGLTVSSSTMVAAIEITPVDYASAQGILSQARIFGGSLGIAASTAILRTKMAGNGSQSGAVRYAEAFRKDMIVATAVSGSAVAVAIIAWWFERKRKRSQGNAAAEAQNAAPSEAAK